MVLKILISLLSSLAWPSWQLWFCFGCFLCLGSWLLWSFCFDSFLRRLFYFNLGQLERARCSGSFGLNNCLLFNPACQRLFDKVAVLGWINLVIGRNVLLDGHQRRTFPLL